MIKRLLNKIREARKRFGWVPKKDQQVTITEGFHRGRTGIASRVSNYGYYRIEFRTGPDRWDSESVDIKPKHLRPTDGNYD